MDVVMSKVSGKDKLDDAPLATTPAAWGSIADRGDRGFPLLMPGVHKGELRLTINSSGESVLGGGVSGLLNLLGLALVELHELGEIELGLLEHLHLLDENVLEREDLGAVLGDLLDDGVGQAKIIYYLLTSEN